MYDGTEPRPLHRAEWEVVGGMAERTLGYLRKRGYGGSPGLPSYYYSIFVAWLSNSAEEIRQWKQKF